MNIIRTALSLLFCIIFLNSNAQSCSDCSSWTPDISINAASVEQLSQSELDFLADPNIQDKESRNNWFIIG